MVKINNRKHKIFVGVLLFLSLFLSVLNSTAAHASSFNKGKLIWSDDFNNSTLSSNNWTVGWFPAWDNTTGITSPVNSFENDCYDVKNVSVSSGYLNLNMNNGPIVCDGVTKPYSASLISSNGKVTVNKGQYVEARIKTDSVNGKIANWPSFWLDGQSWPNDGEIDILEGSSNGACINTHDNVNPNGSQSCINVSPDAYHTYGAYRKLNNTVDFYIDGSLVGTKNINTDAPEYIILGVGTSSDSSVITKAPSTMKIDYVRIYQK